MNRTLPSLWILTQPEADGGPIERLRPVLAARLGPRLGVQLRAKQSSGGSLLEWGRELRTATSAGGSLLAINGRADIAAIVGADAVHLPEAGVPIESLRARWPEIGTVGVSRHDREGLVEAARRGATYAFLGPVFDVPGKNPPLGVEGFHHAAAGIEIPVFALGGIAPHDVEVLTAAGAAGIAVRRAIYEASDPVALTREYLHKLDNKAANIG